MPENDRQHIGPLPPGYETTIEWSTTSDPLSFDDDAGAPFNLPEMMRTLNEIRRRRELRQQQVEPTNYEDWLNQTTYSPEALRAVNMNQDNVDPMLNALPPGTHEVTAEEARMMEEEFRRNMARGIRANQAVREDIATQVVEQFKEKKQREAEPEPLDPAFGDHFM